MTRLWHCEGVDQTTERATTSSPDPSASRQVNTGLAYYVKSVPVMLNRDSLL
jgi:hypothetical protein